MSDFTVCNAENCRLKQERDELAAQVYVMRAAINYCGKQVPELTTVPGVASALSITPSAALREIEARVLEAAAVECDSLDKNGFHYETMDGWDEIPAEACHCAEAIRKMAAAERKGSE